LKSIETKLNHIKPSRPNKPYKTKQNQITNKSIKPTNNLTKKQIPNKTNFNKHTPNSTKLDQMKTKLNKIKTEVKPNPKPN